MKGSSAAPSGFYRRRILAAMRSPVQIPARRVGRHEVEHGVLLPHLPIVVISARQALLTGRRPAAVTSDVPRLVHKLVKVRKEGLSGERLADSILMSDAPEELFEMQSFARRAHGRVLVGGLGLGVVASLLAENARVSSVEVVEREADVIELVAPHMPEKVQVIHADLFAFLHSTPDWAWEHAFLDIWSPTSEAEWASTVAPLRRIITRRFGPRRVSCRAEDVMLGQLRRSLAMGAGMLPLKRHAWSAAPLAFHSAMKEERPDLYGGQRPQGREDAAAEMGFIAKLMKDRPLARAVEAFLSGVGRQAWEMRFGRFWPERVRGEEDAQ